MKKKKIDKTIYEREQISTLNSLFITCLIVGNVVAGRIVNLGFNIFIPASTFCFTFLFLLSNEIQRRFGKEIENTIEIGFICQIIASLIFFIIGLLPTTQEINLAYQVILGQNFSFVFSSLMAYIASQNLNVILQSKFLINKTASTICAQIIDSLVFIVLAFGIGQRWAFQADKLALLGNMIGAQIIVKILLTIILTFLLSCLKKEQK